MECTESFTALLSEFRCVFTVPSFQTFLCLMAGWILTHRRRFVTELIWSSGCTRWGHHSGYHRFFSHAAWSLDALCRVLAKLLVAVFAATGLIELAVDALGNRPDQMFYCTCLDWDARRILATYAARWSIEVTFENSKQLLGLEDAANRKEKAVRRTAPMALVLYSLTVLWFHQVGHRYLQFPDRPWYRRKVEPSFADMLTTLRRLSWRDKIRTLPISRIGKTSPTMVAVLLGRPPLSFSISPSIRPSSRSAASTISAASFWGPGPPSRRSPTRRPSLPPGPLIGVLSRWIWRLDGAGVMTPDSPRFDRFLAVMPTD
ncbi:MAG: transposase [Planctomycetia bacterium]|nr:transposase [Planctomycetia bacterium]